MAQNLAVLNVVALSRSVISEHTPNLQRLANHGTVTTLVPDLPAVTCTSQSSILTGAPVREHGVVANGWYDRDDAEPKFWKQSNALVRGDKVWDLAKERDPAFTCANLFWWFNMYSSVDVSVTPRPQYRADGTKVPDCYTHPASWRDELQVELGPFPLFRFWGPMADITSTRWIARAAMRTAEKFDPTLSLVYLPHLDYALQKFGPGTAEAERAATELDEVIGELIAFHEQRGTDVVLVSEYGIEPVRAGGGAVLVNRVLREAGLLAVREENGRELLDCGASRAFALADHQVAHVYCQDTDTAQRARAALAAADGVERVLGSDELAALELDHERAGELLVVAERGRWCAYGYWEDETRAPDFARTVDIHRKPGYDPCELFVDPAIALPKVRLAGKLLRKKLGFRTLLDVIPLNASLVRGTHGRVEVEEAYAPLLIEPRAPSERHSAMPMRGVRDVLLEHLFREG